MTVDGIVTWIYKFNHWKALLVHHFFVGMPMVIFITRMSDRGSFIVAAFLLTESANIFMNVQAFIELNDGHKRSLKYAAALYTVLALWVASRVALPVWLVHLTHAVALPNTPHDHLFAISFSVVAAWFGMIFCLLVFATVIVREVIDRWTGVTVTSA